MLRYLVVVLSYKCWRGHGRNRHVGICVRHTRLRGMWLRRGQCAYLGWMDRRRHRSSVRFAPHVTSDIQQSRRFGCCHDLAHGLRSAAGRYGDDSVLITSLNGRDHRKRLIEPVIPWIQTLVDNDSIFLTLRDAEPGDDWRRPILWVGPKLSGTRAWRISKS